MISIFEANEDARRNFENRLLSKQVNELISAHNTSVNALLKDFNNTTRLNLHQKQSEFEYLQGYQTKRAPDPIQEDSAPKIQIAEPPTYESKVKNTEKLMGLGSGVNDNMKNYINSNLPIIATQQVIPAVKVNKAVNTKVPWAANNNQKLKNYIDSQDFSKH